jgi:hypothetical protein
MGGHFYPPLEKGRERLTGRLPEGRGPCCKTDVWVFAGGTFGRFSLIRVESPLPVKLTQFCKNR